MPEAGAPSRSLQRTTRVVKCGARNGPGPPSPSTGSARARSAASARHVAEGDQADEHLVAAALGARWRRDQRVIARRCPGEPRQQRGLAEAHVCPRRSRSRATRRGLDPDCPLPQRNPVEVLLQDGLLVEVTLEAERPRDLARLAGPGPRRGPQHPGELHRDGRAAGDDAARRAGWTRPPAPTARGSTPRCRWKRRSSAARNAATRSGSISARGAQPPPAAVLGPRRAQLAADAIEEHERGIRRRPRAFRPAAARPATGRTPRPAANVAAPIAAA